MNKWMILAAFVALALGSSAVLAAPAQVRLLQAPAWLVRDGTRTALRPGRELNAGDSIVTGGGHA